ncbi:MAG: hypothetical protein WBW08_02245 [Methyloceanibacter sp.]
MAFRLVHVRYDEETKRAYVELRDADNNGGEMLATAVFSFRTRARLSKREIEQDVIRKAKYFKIHAFHYTPLRLVRRKPILYQKRAPAEADAG